MKGALRRDEQDELSSLDPYLQSEWQRDKLGADAPACATPASASTCATITLSNGDDSGGVDYSKTTPVAAVLYKLRPTLNLYASAARGFETPTMNELFYSGSGGFNFGLRPSTSVHVELGAKAISGERARIDTAVFQVRTRDELVVDSSSRRAHQLPERHAHPAPGPGNVARRRPWRRLDVTACRDRAARRLR